MFRKLISLPDVYKKNSGWFTLGNTYNIVGEVGNGYKVIADNGIPSIVLKERFV